MNRFEEGRVYRANDSRFDPVRIVKRTKRMVLVENVVHPGGAWRMLLHEDDEKGTEYIVDCNIGDKWRSECTYWADIEVDWGAG